MQIWAITDPIFVVEFNIEYIFNIGYVLNIEYWMLWGETSLILNNAWKRVFFYLDII